MKKKNIINALKSTIVVIFLTFNQSLEGQILDFPEVIQEQSEWCWAGSTKSLLNYFGQSYSQCNIAEYVRTVCTWHNYGSVNCCVNPNAGCNYWNYNWGTAGSMEDILDHFGNINTVNMATYLTKTQISNFINLNHPFIMRWGWYSGGGHFMVGYGISGNDIYYMNPLPGYGYQIGNYNWMVDDGTSHTWTHSQEVICSPAQPGTITGSTDVCPNSVQTYSITPVTGASSYTWTLPSGWSGSSSSNTINVTSGSYGGNISVTADNSCGSGPASQITVNISNQGLPTPSEISGAETVCSESTETYSVEFDPNATSYSWTLPYGWTGYSNTNTITVTSGNEGGTISVVAIGDCGNSPAQTLSVTINNQAPGQPSAINGNNQVCPNSYQTYSVVNDPLASSYQWTLPSGWSGSSASNSINVTTGNYGGQISVTALSSCGNSSPRTLNVSISNQGANQPGPITGNSSVCAQSTQTYIVPNDPNAISYNWTLPNNWTGYSNTNSISVNVSDQGGILSVTANSNCGVSQPRTLNISISNTGPAQPSSINGNASACANTIQTYSVANDPSVSSYTWTLPYGWTGSSSTNTISITTNGNSGDIIVYANSGCGSSDPTSLYVDVKNMPEQPYYIYGNENVCKASSQTYSTFDVYNATSYIWTLPSGWTGSSSTTEINTIAGGNSGTIYVKAKNNCGVSPAQSIIVSVQTVDTSVSVSGHTLTAKAQNAFFQWLSCPSMSYISGELFQTFTPSENGKYAVEVYQDGCTDTSNCHTVIITGLDNLLSSNDVSIFPNPVGDFLNIKFDISGFNTNDIKILNFMGQEQRISKPKKDQDTLILDLRDISSGFYFVVISDDNYHKVFKIVKQ